MKYNTKLILQNQQNFTHELLKINKNFLRALHIEKGFNWLEKVNIFKVNNGFTFNELESILQNNYNIDFNNNIYSFIVFTQYQYRNENNIYNDISVDFNVYSGYYQNSNIKEARISQNHDPENLNIYSINEINKYNNIDIFRKYPKINKDNYIDIKIYLLMQEKKHITKRVQPAHDFLNDRFKFEGSWSDSENYININNHLKYRNTIIDYTEKSTKGCQPGYCYYIKHYIKPDKSGYFNLHIKELKEKAHSIRLEKEKNEVLNYDFTNILNDAKKIKNDIISKFKDIALLCFNERDFNCLADLASYTKNKIYYIDKIINNIKNNKYNNLNELKKDIESNFKYDFKNAINKTKKYILYDYIEKDIESKMMKNKNQSYYYYHLSWTDPDLKLENDILTFNKTIEGFNFDYKINLNDKKIYSFEN